MILHTVAQKSTIYLDPEDYTKNVALMQRSGTSPPNQPVTTWLSAAGESGKSCLIRGQ
jgi:hypothetical protein